MSSEIFLNRGMTLEEVKALLHAPQGNRERAYLRGLYETFFRPRELLLCDVEDFNRSSGEIVARYCKRKYNPKTKTHIEPPVKHMILSPSTILLFRKIISNRKRGAIFINRQGERISLTYFQVYINKLATQIGIQQVTHITLTGKNYHLVTLKSLREAGERHCDLNGADSETTARAAQHSIFVKQRYYKKTNWEDVHQQIRQFHPAFKEGI